MSKVFVIQESFVSRDYSSAQRYGTIHFLLSSENSPGRRPGASMLSIAKKLREEFNYKEDYITWSGGDPLANLIAGICIGCLNVPHINYLRWERERDINGNKSNKVLGFYTPVEVKCI